MGGRPGRGFRGCGRGGDLSQLRELSAAKLGGGSGEDLGGVVDRVRLKRGEAALDLLLDEGPYALVRDVHPFGQELCSDLANGCACIMEIQDERPVRGQLAFTGAVWGFCVHASKHITSVIHQASRAHTSVIFVDFVSNLQRFRVFLPYVCLMNGLCMAAIAGCISGFVVFA